MRETLFNWLQADIAGARCLDLFAGSGALGLEALSRGAAHVTLVEHNRQAAQRLRDNLDLLGEGAVAEVVQADARRLLAKAPPAPYDIVFLDPPFADGLLPDVILQLEHNRWLADAALVYVEQDASHAWPSLPETWGVHREGRAGQSAQRLLRRSNMR